MANNGKKGNKRDDPSKLVTVNGFIGVTSW